MYLLMEPMTKAGLYLAGFVIAVLIIEAFVLFLFKLNSLGKCFLDALMANIGSFLLGVLLLLIFEKWDFEGISETTELITLYTISSIFEAWIIRLLNTRLGWGRIMLASLVMNLPVLAGLYAYISMDITF